MVRRGAVKGQTLPRIAALLGAGASADAGIPTTVRMTDAILERMSDRDHVRLLDFVRHTLAADNATRRSGDASPVDVERLFASVELLINRFEQPWSPFVSAWSPGLESFSTGPRVRGFDLRSDLRAFADQVSQLARGLSGQAGWRQPSGTDVANALAEGLESAFRRARSGDVGALMRVIRDEMLRSLFAVLRIEDPNRVDYLAPLVELAKAQGSLTVATLNYDRTIEELALRMGVECDTGIDTWLKRGELGWTDQALRLLKLHGSIDWVVVPMQEQAHLPLRTIKTVDPSEPGRGEPAVVFGETGKITAEGPYLELLLAWSAQLRTAEQLLVVGYSFRDQHVNEVIARWFNADERRKIVLVDPLPISSWERSFRGHLPGTNQRYPGPEILDRFEHHEGLARDLLPTAVSAISERLSTA